MATPATYRQTIELKKQLEVISGAADKAQRRIDYESAHDEEVLSAIDIVEAFLRDKGRICYGGTAMNMQLPDKYKFYDPKFTIPDYDFLTPNAATDIENLQKRFRAAGFTEIGIRPGMHEGTTKVYINFTPVADITQIHPSLYAMFRKKATTFNGIRYMDVDSLFMMMYLELSRPRGEVGRWEKVYERILLLQYARTYEPCKATKSAKQSVPLPIYRALLNYIVRQERVIAGANLVSVYRDSLRQRVKASWFFSHSSPLIFYSPDMTADVEALKALYGESSDLTVSELKEVGDFIPAMKIVKYIGRPLALIVQETACHSYNTLELHSGQYMRIASLDTLITLYLSLTLSGKKVLEMFFPRSILCMAHHCIELSSYMRRHPKRSQFPFISIECAGHQKGLPSLLREKFGRIHKGKTQKKKSASASLDTTTTATMNNITIVNKGKRGKTVRNKGKK